MWAPEPAWTKKPEEKSFASMSGRTLVVQAAVRPYADPASLVPYKYMS